MRTDDAQRIREAWAIARASGLSAADCDDAIAAAIAEERDLPSFSRRAARRLRQRLGLRYRAPYRAPIDRGELHRLHAQGLATQEIARRLGATYRTVQEIMHREGLRAHRRGRPAPAARRRTVHLAVRLSPEEAAQLDALRDPGETRADCVRQWITAGRAGDIQQFDRRVKDAFPNVQITVDEPSNADGRWFLDVVLGDYRLVVEWMAGKGFGLSASPAEGYGEGPEEAYRDVRKATERALQLLSTRGRTHPPREVWLRDLREQIARMTQEEFARHLGVKQAAVSKMERRRDTTIGTLRRAIEAMGGTLEVLAHFPNGTYQIAQFEEASAGQCHLRP